MATTIRELVGSLPYGALREIVDWLRRQDRVDSTTAWRKEDFIESVCSKVSRADAESLHAAARVQPPYFPLGLLASVFGHLSKEQMLDDLERAELRDLVQKLDDEHRVAVNWRSRSPDWLRRYLIQKLSVAEIAQAVGLAPVASAGAASAVSSRLRPHAGGDDSPLAVEHADRAGSAARDPEASLKAPDVPATHPQNGGVARTIEKLEDLHRYLVDGLQTDLEALEEFGSNEQRFQHHIVRTLEARLSRDPFRLEEKFYLAETGQYPDIAIIHARGHVLFEIKPKGALDDLLVDASKLRGYLRNKKMNVTFGVLIYRSPREVPVELSRAMRGDNLHLVRVRSLRR